MLTLVCEVIGCETMVCPTSLGALFSPGQDSSFITYTFKASTQPHASSPYITACLKVLEKQRNLAPPCVTVNQPLVDTLSLPLNLKTSHFMIRRSHKKSRQGCAECKRSHKKVCVKFLILQAFPFASIALITGRHHSAMRLDHHVSTAP